MACNSLRNPVQIYRVLNADNLNEISRQIVLGSAQIWKTKSNQNTIKSCIPMRERRKKGNREREIGR